MATTETITRTPRQMPKFLNQLMSSIIRSPLHSLVDKHIMLLEFQGRKSGKTYTTPVGYVRQGDELITFTDHTWWKNLRTNPGVRIYMQGKWYQSKAEVVHEDKEAVAEGLLTFARLSKSGARAYGVKLDASGQPVPASVQQAAQWCTLIRIPLS